MPSLSPLFVGNPEAVDAPEMEEEPVQWVKPEVMPKSNR
jgi:hypothetical protein